MMRSSINTRNSDSATFYYYLSLKIILILKWKSIATDLQGQLELQQLCVAGSSVTEQFGIIGVPLNGLRVMFHSYRVVSCWTRRAHIHLENQYVKSNSKKISALHEPKPFWKASLPLFFSSKAKSGLM